jgi:hypothetical protein
VGLALAHAKEEEEKRGAWYGAAPRDRRRGGPPIDQDPTAAGTSGARREQARDGAPIGGPEALCRVLNQFTLSE